MKAQNRYIAIAAAIGMMILIFDGDTALSGATEGINVCISTIIPSLFPFFVISILLSSSLIGQTVPLLRPIGAICRIPNGAESLFSIGILGGYPVGAQNIALLHRMDCIDHSQSRRLLPICNNAGPAFIFGVLGPLFGSTIAPLFLWLIQIASAIMVGMLLRGEQHTEDIHVDIPRIQITDALSQAVKVMAQVCGWIVFTRMLLAFADAWFLHFMPLPLRIIFSGILELSNGCIRLAGLESEGLRFIIASSMLSFGGICVTLQTASAADGISMDLYFTGKLLQCGISTLLSALLQFIFPFDSRFHNWNFILLTVGAILLILLLFDYFKKTVAFRALLVYNRLNNIKEVSSCCFGKK